METAESKRRTLRRTADEALLSVEDKTASANGQNRQKLFLNSKAGRFELLNMAGVDDQWHYNVRSTTDEVFSVVRPDISTVKEEFVWVLSRNGERKR